MLFSKSFPSFPLDLSVSETCPPGTLLQKEITVGMSSTDVIVALGSPNIITTDDERRENWVYDKIATQNFVSASAGRPSLLWFVPSEANAGSSSSQRTLTIIIKFDKENKVRDFAYHTSRF